MLFLYLRVQGLGFMGDVFRVPHIMPARSKADRTTVVIVHGVATRRPSSRLGISQRPRLLLKKP